MARFPFAVLLTALLALVPAVTGKEPAKATSAAGAAGAANPKKPVDRNEVLSLYMEGDFETLVALLENIRRERELRDKQDSVFIYKFLGVIYGADDRTIRKAESFLYQMLELDPNEDLSALGVGESVQKIFERVRTRIKKDTTHLVRTAPAPSTAASAPATAASPSPQPQPVAPAEPQPEKPVAKSRRETPAWVWYTCGGAAAAVVLGAIILNQTQDTKVHAISDTLQ